MDLSKKLAEWVEAGLIDGEARARIEAHEGAHRRPLMLYAMLGLGAFTVGLGIISVVAANWADVPDRVKLAVDLVLAAGLGAATFETARRGKLLATDVLAVVYYLFTLASIALIGQVYQLTAPSYQALLLWSAVTAPLAWLGHSRWLGLLWCGGLSLTYVVSLEPVLDLVPRNAMRADLGVTLAGGFLLAGFAATRGLVAPRKPLLARGIHTGLMMQLLVAAAACTAPWYERINERELLSVGLVALGAMGLLAHRMLPWLMHDATGRARGGVAAFLGIAWLSLSAGTLFEHESVEAAGGLLQLAMLGALAWTAIQSGRVRTFNALTGLIALRILITYFEIFGSMLETGMGMITGGMLTLLMAWLWRRKSPELARQLGGESGGEAS